MTALPPPDYTLNEDGERVIAASRRPDGTVRKERRVRSGYVPQDEQAVYVSRGAAMRQSVPKCPGFDESAAEPAKPKTKAAAKNAKRKEKKLAEAVAGGGGGGVAAAAAAVEGLSLGSSGGGGGGGKGAAAAAAPAPAAAQAPPAAAAAGPPPPSQQQQAEEEPSVEKQIRALKKKMRQAEALAEKQAGGQQQLSAEELAKLARLPDWQEELRQLEAQL